MASVWAMQFANCARFDYIKLRFKDTHPLWQSNVQQVIAAAYQEVCKGLTHERPKNPKWTILEPSSSRPNGYIIVEAWGVAAELVHHIPSGWMEYLTYAHVKSFGHTPEGGGIDDIKAMYESAQGPRSLSITYPGTKSRSDKGSTLPSIRSGSRKSGIHLITYQRQGGAVGKEGRFRDEQVADMTLDVIELTVTRNLPDTSAWRVLLFNLARKTAEAFERDYFSRDREPFDFFIPAPYTSARPNMPIEEYVRRQLDLKSAKDGEHYEK